MIKLKFIFIFLSLLLYAQLIRAQMLYDINTIQQINIHFSQANYDYQMDTAKAGAQGYIVADWVEINGQEFDSVGVKYKGNSSYDSTYFKNPLHISLDQYHDQSYEGYTDIKLGNEYADPSYIREALAYNVLGNYMDCPKSNFAELFINDSLIGIFSNDESISKKFCSDHFYSSNNTFVKCNPFITSAAFKSNLKYINADSSSYQVRYDLQSDYGWNDLVALCDSLSNNQSSFSNMMDVDRVIWMLAYNNVIVNLDSYSGAFSQNHYVYRDNTGHYNSIVWDLNMAFGGFPFAGSQGIGMGTLDTTGMQTMPLTLHSAESDWPLINIVLNNPFFKRMYVAHMKTIVDEMFVSGNYLSEAAFLQSIIDADVQIEPHGFFNYSQFQNGMNHDVSVSSHFVPGISNLMNARVSYLQSTAEFNYAAPQISNVNVSDTAPAYLSNVTITAEVSNANSNAVYLGYRFDKTQKFSRVLMYDDGAHNDGAAGDGEFGIDINMVSAVAQYYIYAENNDAGIFSPQRAEHEYYHLNAGIPLAQTGEVVINEFLAVNVNDTVDETGAHEDWIELYNTTQNPLNLFGLYLSDTYLNLTKFAFPENSVIQPHGYFMIWADEDNTTTGDLHCNFKLSSSGENIFLSNVAGNMLDSVSFGTQIADHSMARCPNGTGPFIELNHPSFEAANHCTDGIAETQISASDILIYPNPVNERVEIFSSHPGKKSFVIMNSLGEVVFANTFDRQLEINSTDWPSGIYIFSYGAEKRKIMVVH